MSIVFLALVATPFNPSPVAWAEAENCACECRIEREPGASPLASGGKTAPNYWGQTPGDRITWHPKLEQKLAHPWLAIRYAFGKAAFGRNPESPRTFRVRVGDREIEVKLPDTGSWANYTVAWTPLPDLPAGASPISIETTEADTNADIDCLGLFSARPDQPDAPFVSSLIAKSRDGRFLYRRSPGVAPSDPQATFAAFARIADEMEKVGGWKATTPIGINVIEDKNWPNPGWSAYSNEQGCFFRASMLAKDQGNWCHEMNHVMFDGRIPKWLDESLVRIQTRLIWIERLYPEPEAARAYRQTVDAACARYSDPKVEFDSVEDVLRVLVGRFGEGVLVRFLRACSEAGNRGQLDFRPNRNLTTAEILRYFSQAAGEDVAPIFRRWRGFAQIEHR